MNLLDSPLSFPPLRDHQNHAIADAVSELAMTDRTVLHMACATGKTRIGAEVAVRMAARTVVLYVPSLALLRQSIPDWLRAGFAGGVQFLCVCSDASVAAALDEDEAEITVAELRADLGMPETSVTTDPDVIRAFLSNPDSPAARIIFSTYQSSDAVRDGCPEGFRFDLGVFDEAHRTATRWHSAFSAPLDDNHTPIAKRLFMTATPKHYDLRKRDKEGEGRVVFSMDDEALYGKVAHRLPIRKAIEAGIIAGYKILVSVVTDEQIRQHWGGGVVTPERWEQDTEAVAHAIALREAMEKYGLKKAITFHDSVAEARSFADNATVQRELASATFHVNGSQPAAERDRIMDDFAGAERAVITNARCLTEGVDVPAIDLVAFLHPRKSHIDIVQAVGRALRIPRDRSKTMGYILLPLYVRKIEGGVFEKALEEFGYDTIWAVLQAMREQDEVVEQWITDMSRARGKGKEPELREDLIEVHGMAVHLDYLRKAITTHCVDAVGDSWEEWFGLLMKAKEQTGNPNVLTTLVIDGRNIGSWLRHQRQDFKAGTLLPEREAKLRELGIEFDVLNAQWQENFDALAAYIRQTGNPNVLTTFVIDGRKIGVWLKNHRKAFKAGTLLPEREAKLRELGIEFDLFDAQWQENFDALAAYIRQTGNQNVPKRLVIDGRKIGSWFCNQRTYFYAGTLLPEREAKLRELGIEFDALNAQWQENFDALAAYIRQTGNPHVPWNLVLDGRNIGVWINNQRRAFKTGSLSPEREAKLRGLGIEFDVRNMQWQENFDALAVYIRQTGNPNVPQNLVLDGRRIGTWIRTQWAAFKAGTLLPEHEAKLRSIGVHLQLKNKNGEA